MAVKKQGSSTKGRGKSIDIRSICAALGYSSDYKDDRNWNKLNRPITVFRKSYTQKAPQEVSFDGEHKADVRACATDFLEKHQVLFQDFNPVGKFRWLVYANPKDRAKIVTGIARIMCEQVRNKKRNGASKTVDLQPQVVEPQAAREPVTEDSIIVAVPPYLTNSNQMIPDEHIQGDTRVQNTEIHVPVSEQVLQMGAAGSGFERQAQSSGAVPTIENVPTYPLLEHHPRAPVAPMYGIRSPAPSPPPHEPRIERTTHSSIRGRTTSASSLSWRSSATNHTISGPLTERDRNKPLGHNANDTSNTSHRKAVLDIPYPQSLSTATPSAPPALGAISKTNNSLWFALPGPTGDPDLTISKLVPAEVFRNSTLPQFFQLVASRSGRPVQDLAFLTLKCAWGFRTAVVVNRYHQEEQWNFIKEKDILERYRMEQSTNSLTSKRLFVWVFLGNTSNVDLPLEG